MLLYQSQDEADHSGRRHIGAGGHGVEDEEQPSFQVPRVVLQPGPQFLDPDIRERAGLLHQTHHLIGSDLLVGTLRFALVAT